MPCWWWQSEPCCTVVQHHTCTDNFACLCWGEADLTVQAMPSTFKHTNASFDSASRDAVGVCVCSFLAIQWIQYRCEQPVSKHVATVAK